VAAFATVASLHATSANVLAVTPTAAALVASVDKQLKRKIVKAVRIYVNGHWQTFYPGRSHDFPLYTSEGVVLQMKSKGKWRPPAGSEPFAAPTVHLHRGWNFVAAPYPLVHMTCHATRLELARSGDKLEQITVGPAPNVGVVMRPKKHGQWGQRPGHGYPERPRVLDQGRGLSHVGPQPGEVWKRGSRGEASH
jgi:hypothetical protein